LAATLDLTGKTVTLPAGVGGHASGTEANRPAAPAIGTIYFNTDEDTLQQYTSAGWLDVGVVPVSISTISGTIYNTIATNLTITGSGFGLSATVRFSYGGSTSDVAVTPDSDNQITVAVPSAVYNQASGTSVTISVLAGGQVSNGSSKTVMGLPTGGTITTASGYRIHTFLSSSNLVVPSGFSANAEYLIVAGGGGAGGALSGGAGAGGYRTNVSGETSGGGASAESAMSISAQTYNVTVGIGGSGTNNIGSGNNGTNSSFNGIISLGGGGSASGGSGAGYARYAGTGLPGTVGQGYKGGDGFQDDNTGGGGGGAGAPGGNAVSGASGNGGAGVTSSITGSPVPRAGGGGGGGRSQPNPLNTAGTGGAGGGGSANASAAGSPGNDNTGGGGGAGWLNNGEYTFGGNGGDGIVIIRYPIPT
jgi:hypothetical protein